MPLLLLVAIVLSLETGRWLRQREIRTRARVEPARFGIVDGAVFGLMGLILAFSFAAAGNRFDLRRQYIVEETNAIGTAWLRLDVLDDAARESLRGKFRRYLDARIEGYGALPDSLPALRAWARADSLQQAIWSEAVSATRVAPTPGAPVLLLPSLNEMFDITTTRRAAIMAHLPRQVFELLVILVLACGVVAGYGITGAGPRSWLHILGFSLVIVITLHVIMDYEYPRLGRITVRDHDQLMVNLRASMGD